MSRQNFNNIKDVCPGSFTWHLKVRIVRFWRGVSKTGEEFKGFNILLLDDKVCVKKDFQTFSYR